LGDHHLREGFFNLHADEGEINTYGQSVNHRPNLRNRAAKLFKMMALCVSLLLLKGNHVALAQEVLCLAKDRQAQTAIIIPDEAIPPERFAAEELQHHVEKATGATLSIYPEREAALGYEGLIYLGNCRKTSEVGIDVTSIEPSGYIVRTVGGSLFLAGRDRFRGGEVDSAWCANWQGTLFAVYDLLENDLGVRWLWPGELGEIVPAAKTIELGPVNRSGAPRYLEARLCVPGYPSDALGWASEENKKNFLEAQRVFLLRHRLVTVQNMAYGHHFQEYWKKFGQTRPEFFNMLPNGEREPLPGDDGSNITLCVSQPALWAQIVSEWSQHPERNPDNIPYRPFVNACENDTPGMCACPTCRSWDAPDPLFKDHDYWGKGIIPDRAHRFSVGVAPWSQSRFTASKEGPSLADRYALFYLSVLEEAKKVDKDAKVIGYAYANYWKAPKAVELNEDVIISYVPPLWFPYTEEQSREFRENWDGWRNAGVKHLVLRPNLTHAGTNLPVFYARKLAADFTYAAERGMIATAFDSLLGAYSAQGPTLYTLARIHEHPDWSADRILDEYYSGFGPAQVPVQRYFEYWEKHSDSLDPSAVERICREEQDSQGRPGGGFKNYVRIAHRIFPPETFVEARGLLSAAIEGASGDELAERRVAYLEKGLTDAEMTAAVRAAQSNAEKKPSDENNHIFEDALRNLVAYRASVEADYVCNFGHAAYREKNGSGWNHAL